MEEKRSELVYVMPMFGNKKCQLDDLYHYKLYFSSNPDDTWGLDWDIDNVLSIYEEVEDTAPDKSTYDKIVEITSKEPLKTIEETSCYSIEYATFGIIALCWTDIDRMTEYPENGRFVLHFGENEEEVGEKLKKHGIFPKILG